MKCHSWFWDPLNHLRYKIHQFYYLNLCTLKAHFSINYAPQHLSRLIRHCTCDEKLIIKCWKSCSVLKSEVVILSLSLWLELHVYIRHILREDRTVNISKRVADVFSCYHGNSSLLPHIEFDISTDVTRKVFQNLHLMPSTYYTDLRIEWIHYRRWNSSRWDDDKEIKNTMKFDNFLKLNSWNLDL